MFLPDGVTPAGANVIVTLQVRRVRSFCAEDASCGETVCTTIPQGIQEEIVVTDAERPVLRALVNAGAFTLTAEDPVTGKVARICVARSGPGEQADIVGAPAGLAA